MKPTTTDCQCFSLQDCAYSLCCHLGSKSLKETENCFPIKEIINKKDDDILPIFFKLEA